MKALKQAMLGTVALMTLIAFQNCGKLSVEISGDESLLSTGQQYKFTILGPEQVAIGTCAPYFIDRTSISGGSLPATTEPYPVEAITIPTDLQPMVFADDTCMTPAPNTFTTEDLPIVGYFMSTSAFQGDVYLMVGLRPTNKIAVTAQ